MVALLVICGCGRLHFEASDEVLAITAPAPDAEVEGSAIIVGTCRSGLTVVLRGDGLADGAVAPCTTGAFAAPVVFSDGDGPKPVTVSQDAAAVMRSFLRVTPARLRTTAVGTQASAGSMVDCDLIVPRPSELAPGDLLFGMIYADNGPAGSIATPGFQRTKLDGFSHVAFWKVAGAGEPATYTFPVDAGTGVTDTCESAGVLAAFAHVSSMILAESAAVDLDGTVEAPGVTAPKRGILVAAWGANGPVAGFSQTGMQAAAEASSAGDFASVLVAYQGIQPGDTGSRTATLPVARPAAAGLFVLDGKP